MYRADYKKILILGGFIVLCVVIFIGIYLLFFKPVLSPDEGLVDQRLENIQGELPQVREGDLPAWLDEFGQLPDAGDVTGEDSREEEDEPDLLAKGSDTLVRSLTGNDRVMNVSLSDSGQGVSYYNYNDDRFYKTTADGDRILLSDEEFYNVQDVNWSNDGSAVIMEYPDGMKLYYDFATGKKSSLPKEVKEIDFTSNDKEIVFKYDTGDYDTNYLSMANADGTGARLIEHMGDNGNKVQVNVSPNSEVVAFYKTSTGIDSSEIFLVGQHGENFYSLETNGSKFESKWSPSGDKLLYSVAIDGDNYYPNLFLTDGDTQNIGLNKKNLNINTWTDKCVFRDDVILYCAVPKTLPEYAGVYRDDLESFFGDDEIYEINLQNKSSKKLASPVDEDGNTNFLVEKLILSSDYKKLFLWDKKTDAVYTMNLR
jgi:hypothetical protein